MNEPNKTDFFPVSDEQLKNLTYQDTEEDLSHEEHLKELDEKIFADSDVAPEDELGELPFDEEADRQRWENLEKDFDRVFDEAENSGY
jgi:hypothetical protein